MSRNRVSRLMKSLRLHSRPPRKFKITTDSNHQRPVAPNRLNRHFQVKDKKSSLGRRLSWYNSVRIHSSIGDLSPIEYENLNDHGVHVA